MGAIASLVDEIGAAVIHEEGNPIDVSVDMSISYISDANINDELEITSRSSGRKGGYHGTHVLIRNKTTGEVVAEGRQLLSLLRSLADSSRGVRTLAARVCGSYTLEIPPSPQLQRNYARNITTHLPRKTGSSNPHCYTSGLRL